MLTELRPNKELLDPQFNGYKLSLDPIPIYRQTVPEGVDHVTQSEDQYSFIHTKVFSLHNHLFSDPWHENTVFFIDKSWKVLKAAVSPETGRVEVLESVWTVPNLVHRETGHFNTSLVFVSPEIAVLADGCGWLHVLNCHDNTLWLPELSSEVVGADCGSMLVCARLAADATLHCVLMTVESVTSETQTNSARTDNTLRKAAAVNTVLHWLTLVKDSSGTWAISCTRCLEGSGSVDYAALEASCSALYIASNTNFKFTADSANPLPPPEEKMDSDDAKPLYTWQQTEDDLKIVVEVAAGVTRDDLEVTVGQRELTIKCQKQVIVTGPLSQAVDTDLTTWTLQPDKLEVTLSKREVGLMWTELVTGDSKSRQVLDPVVVADVHTRLGHLCTDTEVREAGEEFAPTFNLEQLEECDSAPDDYRSLARLDTITHTVSHQISLAGHQWLMSLAQDPECAPCVCIRHDVDGCVWRLDTPSSSEWPCQHIGTFFALGYVAASKQQKKFIVAAPDLSYAVICEAANHVFVYRRSSAVDGELRNRKTSTKFTTVAKQQLINLESRSPVLGAHATNSYLFILTTDTLYTFHIQ